MSPDLAQAASLVVVATGAFAGLLAYFKFKPGQREHVDMTVAQANLNIAQGTVKLVTSELEDQFRRMSAEMAEVRAEHRRYREETDSRLSALFTELSSEKSAKEAVKAENARLRDRVAALEGQVADLKSR